MEAGNSKRLSNEEVAALMAKQPNLKKQSYEDIGMLTALSQEVISRQPTLNIGTIGHVAHGKSTLVRAISGVHTVRFKQEKVRNITIRLGYANAKIYKCPICPAPQCYKSCPSMTDDDSQTCQKCPEKSKLQLIKHVSFVDCPGHDILLSTMLTGAAVMDAALLLIAANMDCPQPQTAEHLVALEIMKLQNIIVIQNKVDIIFKDEGKAEDNYKQIKEFIKDTLCKNAPIIPISAQLKYNIDAVCESIDRIPIPERKLKAPPKMIIIRSFDVNKPGSTIDQLKGGVVGGSLLEGVLEVGMEIEIRPGHAEKDEKGNTKWTPIRSRIVSLIAQQNSLLYAVPGGLIGVGLLVDPSLTRNDRMIGSVLGVPGQLPPIYTVVDIVFRLMKRLLGCKTEGSDKHSKVSKITEAETLKFNVGSTEIAGKVLSVKDDVMKVHLITPVCTSLQSKVAISRRIDKKFRLIGWGEIKAGKTIE